MRLFVAIPLPARVRAAVQSAVRGTPAFEELGADRAVRAVDPALWHVTVAFLGEVERSDVADVRAVWAARAGVVGPLTLRIAGAGAFPDARRARVMWAGVDVDPTAWERLAPDGATPHVTLARCRPARDVRDAVAALARLATHRWRCPSLALVESRADPDVTRRYTRVATLPLA